MAVYKRRTKKGIRWGYDKTVKGVRLQTGALWKQRQEAETAEREAVSRLLNGEKIPSCEQPGWTFGNLCDARLVWVKAHRSKSYVDDHATVFKRIKPEFKNLRPEDVTADMAQGYLDEYAQALIETGFDLWSVNRVIRVMQATYNHPWGRRRGAARTFEHNPWSEVEFASVERQAKFVPSHRVIQQLRVAATEEERLLLEIMVATGARPGEARQIQWYDINCELRIVNLYTRKKRDGSLTPRPVPLSDDIIETLKRWQKKNEGTRYVFEGEREGEQPPAPRSYRWALNRQRELCERANVPYFSLHSYRHYYASKAVQEGIDLVTVQRLLGHEAASTTDLYLHTLGAK